MGHATYTNESCHISNHWKSKGLHARRFANESWHIYKWGMPHIHGRHAMYTNELCDISHHWKRKGLHTRARRFRSRCIGSSSQRTCSHVAHIQMGHVTSRAPRSVDSHTNKCVLMLIKSMRHVISLHFRVRRCDKTHEFWWHVNTFIGTRFHGQCVDSSYQFISENVFSWHLYWLFISENVFSCLYQWFMSHRRARRFRLCFYVTYLL